MLRTSLFLTRCRLEGGRCETLLRVRICPLLIELLSLEVVTQSLFICYLTLSASTDHVRSVLCWGCKFVKGNASILLLVKTSLDLHPHQRLRILYLVREIPFIMSLWRNLSWPFGPVVEHRFEVDVVHLYRHFPLILREHGKVNQRCLLLGEIACPTPCELDTLSLFRGYFFTVKNY